MIDPFDQRSWEEMLKELVPTFPLQIRIESLTPEEHLMGLTFEQRLKGIPPEQRLAGLAPEERLAGMPTEQRLAGLAPEELLAGLTPQQLTKLAEALRGVAPPNSPQKPSHQ